MLEACARLLELTHVGVPYKLPALLIPEAKRQTSQAGSQGNGLDLLEEAVALVTLLQVVVGNARTQVVDMVEADVARKPLQHLRQLVERAAPQRGRRIVPMLAALPVNIFELMLHVEEPEAGRASDRQHDGLNEQVWSQAEDPCEPDYHAENRGIREPYRATTTTIRFSRTRSGV